MYPPIRKNHTLGDYKSLGIRTAEQDGRKHYLLCDNCEQYLGDAEGYVAILQDEVRSRERLELGIRFHEDETVTGWNYDLILRFLTGIAWKANQVDSAPYHNTVFSDGYISDCEQILKGKQSKQKFSFLAMRFVCEVSEEIDPRAMIFVQRNYFQGIGEAFVILAAGWEWNLIRHKDSTKDWPDFIKALPFKRGSPALIPCGEITDHRFLTNKYTEINDDHSTESSCAARFFTGLNH